MRLPLQTWKSFPLKMPCLSLTSKPNPPPPHFLPPTLPFCDPYTPCGKFFSKIIIVFVPWQVKKGCTIIGYDEDAENVYKRGQYFGITAYGQPNAVGKTLKGKAVTFTFLQIQNKTLGVLIAQEQAYIVGCRGVWQLGGLIPVVRLGVPLGCKAWKLYDPLGYPLGNERTLVWQ